jgi:hypothetical protein
MENTPIDIKMERILANLQPKPKNPDTKSPFYILHDRMGKIQSHATVTEVLTIPFLKKFIVYFGLSFYWHKGERWLHGPNIYKDTRL